MLIRVGARVRVGVGLRVRVRVRSRGRRQCSSSVRAGVRVRIRISVCSDQVLLIRVRSVSDQGHKDLPCLEPCHLVPLSPGCPLAT